MAAVLAEDQSVILAGCYENELEVKLVDIGSVTKLVDLESSHEEADTRMVLQGIDLSNTFQRLIFRWDDTDVLVILTYFHSMNKFGESLVFLHAGHTGINT